jgi:hypothetical protein
MSSHTSKCEIAATPGGPHSSQWSGPDLVLGSALVVVLASLFLPWFAAADMGAVAAAGAAGQTHGGSTVSGVAAHGYMWIVCALVIVALAVLVGRDSFGRLPGNLPSAGQMLVGATALALLVTLFGLLMKPTVWVPFGYGWSFGGVIAVVGTTVSTAAALESCRSAEPAEQSIGAAKADGLTSH